MVREIFCEDCGTLVITPGHNTTRCKECQKEHTRKQARERDRQRRNSRRLYPGPTKSIPEIERERHIYNKEHGTSLSYGQYVLKVEGIPPSGKKRR